MSVDTLRSTNRLSVRENEILGKMSVKVLKFV